MTSWLEAGGETTSPLGHEAMDHEGMDMEGMSHEEAMAELESLSGAEFDRRFLELTIAHHRGAVEMAQTQFSEGQNRQALDLAKMIIDDQQERSPRWRNSSNCCDSFSAVRVAPRSEEHTSELQSRGHLVCRLLLEKKKKKTL